MKSLKMNGLTRLLAFFLIAVILISVVSIAVGGRQSNPNNEPDSGDVGNQTDETDENKDGQGSGSEDKNTEPTPPTDDATVNTPKYYSIMTGLEISKEQSESSPIAFLVDSSAPLYGVSNADITFEIPTENGKTRFLVYQTNTESLWKIGSLAPARAFISSLTNIVGGTIVSYGNDDILRYDSQDYSNQNLNIKNNSDSYYLENTTYIYTGIDRINELTKANSKFNNTGYKTAPFLFSDNEFKGTASASTVILPYSESSESIFYYSDKSESYTLYKSGNKVTDKLTGDNLSYKNLFVLFANSTTYENADGKELVLDTYSGGHGYYASSGSMIEIRWSISEDGSLIFKTLNGDILSVTPGNSYVGFYKSSVSSEVVFR